MIFCLLLTFLHGVNFYNNMWYRYITKVTEIFAEGRSLNRMVLIVKSSLGYPPPSTKAKPCMVTNTWKQSKYEEKSSRSCILCVISTISLIVIDILCLCWFEAIYLWQSHLLHHWSKQYSIKHLTAISHRITA